MKKSLNVTKKTETHVIISGFTVSELNELLSTEYKESMDMILSRVDKKTSDLIRKSHIKYFRAEFNKIIFVIEDAITCQHG